MGKKVIILNGSPRAKGNTSTLIKEFARGAEEVGCFDDALQYYQNLMKHLGWTEIGHVLAGGVMKVGDINGNKKLAKAYELGKKVVVEDGL